MSSNSELKTYKDRSAVRKGNKRKKKNKEKSIDAKSENSLMKSKSHRDGKNDGAKSTMDIGEITLMDENVFGATPILKSEISQDLNNNEATAQLYDDKCYSSKHKKFRKRSFVSSTSSTGDFPSGAATCDNESMETEGSSKNLPIKKRRKFLENDANGEMSNVDFADKMRSDGVKLENDGKSMKHGVKSKFQDSTMRNDSNVSNNLESDVDAKCGWQRYPNYMKESHRDWNNVNVVKSEVFDSQLSVSKSIKSESPGECDNLAKTQGHQGHHYQEHKINYNEFFSGSNEFYQKRKATDKLLPGAENSVPTRNHCLHPTAHVLVAPPEKRKDFFLRNWTGTNFDWLANETHAFGGHYQARHSSNLGVFSGYQTNLGSAFQFSNIENFKAQHTQSTGRIKSNILRNKVKYERQIEENPAICAAGPAMAEGTNFIQQLIFSFITNQNWSIKYYFMGLNCYPLFRSIQYAR